MEALVLVIIIVGLAVLYFVFDKVASFLADFFDRSC